MLKILFYTEKNNPVWLQSFEEYVKQENGGFVWIDFYNVENIEEFNPIIKHFKLHELTVEDALMPGHSPKLEIYEEYYFMIFRGLHEISEMTNEIKKQNKLDELTYKVAIYFSEKYLITIHQQQVSWLENACNNIVKNPEKYLKRKSLSLLHYIVDLVVDEFLYKLKSYSKFLRNLEDRLMDKPKSFDIFEIWSIKRLLSAIERVSTAQSNVIYRLCSDEQLILDKIAKRYFRDVYDHVQMISAMIMRFQDEVQGLRDIFFSWQNMQVSDIMRILTVITTIMAPLHLVVGFYGMNFPGMPLLHTAYGFWCVFSFMVLLVLVMIGFFRFKRWL